MPTKRTALPLIAAAILAGCHDVMQPLAVESSAPRFAATASGGGTLYGVAYSGDYPSGVNQVFTIDPATGQLGEAVAFPTMDGIAQAISAFDRVGQRYFVLGSFRTATGNVTRVVSADLATGTTSTASQASGVSSLEYHNGSGTLYGAAYLGSYPSGHTAMVSVDPVSGERVEVGSLPGIEGISLGASAFDQNGGRYFLVGSVRNEAGTEQRVFTFEVATRTTTVSTSPLPRGVSSLEFDSSAGVLYGVMYVGSYPNGRNKLVAIDPATGGTTEVLSLPVLDGLASGVSALDSASGRYFVVGVFRAAAGTEYRLVSLHPGTGETAVASQPFSRSPSSLQFQSEEATPAQTIGSLIGTVQALANSGALKLRPAGALASQLEAARKSLEREKTEAAVGQLRAFVKQCEALVRGRKLTTSQAKPLIDVALGVIARLQF